MTEYVLKPSVVRDLIEATKEPEIHAHFAAYLGLVRFAHNQGTNTDLKWNYDPYFEQFYRLRATEVRNMMIEGSEKLYINPFMDRNIRSMWRGENVAGSFSKGTAGRSRSEYGIARVVDIDTDAGEYSLKPNHGELARERLCYGEKIPATSVAGFLLRDYAIIADEEPELTDLVELFREDHGLAEDHDNGDAFDEVFYEDAPLIDDAFEVNDD